MPSFFFGYLNRITVQTFFFAESNKAEMLKHHQCLWWFLLLFSIGIMIPYLEGVVINKKNDHQVIKTKTYMTPFFTLKPGHVVERFFYNTNFPEGHIAIKSFDVEVVDEEDNPIPLFETYLHHWGILRYYYYCYCFIYCLYHFSLSFLGNRIFLNITHYCWSGTSLLWITLL